MRSRGTGGVVDFQIPAEANVHAVYAGVVIERNRTIRTKHRPSSVGWRDLTGRRSWRLWVRGPVNRGRRGAGGVTLAALGGLLALFLAIPVAALVVRAVATGSLSVAFATPAVMDALTLSLATTSVSLVVILLFGTPLAYVLARRRFRGAGIVSRPCWTCPSFCRPRSPAWPSSSRSAAPSLLGGALDVAHIQIPFSTLAVVMAQTFVAAPFLWRGPRGAEPGGADSRAAPTWAPARKPWLGGLPMAGAGRWRGAVCAGGGRWGSSGRDDHVPGNLPGVTQTMPLVVYSRFQSGDLEASIAAATILILAAFGVLIAVRTLAGLGRWTCAGWGRRMGS